MSLDGLIDLAAIAERCKSDRNVSARDLRRHFDQLFDRFDQEAQAALYQQNGFAGSGDDPVEEDLRAAGWKVEDHPRFVGRAFVFHAFHAFLREKTDRGGVFVVRASAGMGKTALMTELIRRSGHDRAGFYFRYRDGRVGPGEMARAIWDQLGKRYGLPSEEVPPEPQFTGKLEERLRSIARTNLAWPGNSISSLTALDEAEQPEKAVALIPKTLPPRVFVITSSRPPGPGSDHLAGLTEAGAKVLVLDEYARENEQDIFTFLAAVPRHTPRPEECRLLAAAAGGSFMLATLFAEALEKGEQTADSLLRQAEAWDELPSSGRLFGFYKQSWKRACRLVPETALDDFASLLAAAMNWISERRLAEVLTWNDRRREVSERVWKGGTFKRVEAALGWMLDRRNWEKAGHAAEYLQLRHQTNREFVVNLRHHSVRDFIVGADGPAWRGLEDAHEVIATYYLDEAERIGWDNVDAYGRWYVVRHLIRQESSHATRRAAALLSTPGYLQATLGTGNAAPG